MALADARSTLDPFYLAVLVISGPPGLCTAEVRSVAACYCPRRSMMGLIGLSTAGYIQAECSTCSHTSCTASETLELAATALWHCSQHKYEPQCNWIFATCPVQEVWPQDHVLPVASVKQLRTDDNCHHSNFATRPGTHQHNPLAC
jgi:hypothetical protein